MKMELNSEEATDLIIAISDSIDREVRIMQEARFARHTFLSNQVVTRLEALREKVRSTLKASEG